MRRAIPVDPVEQVPDILFLLVVQRMEDPAHALGGEFGPVFFSLLALFGQLGVAGENGGDDDGLEFEERERRGVVGHADECQSGVWDVEDVLVQVVHLRAVRHQDCVAGVGGRCLVVVVVGQEGQGDVVSGAEDDGVDVAELLTGLEMDDEWEGGVRRECRVGSISFLCDFKRLDLAHPDAILGQGAGRKIKEPIAGALVDFSRDRAQFTGDISRRDAGSEEKDVLQIRL
ncbi:hypothetical protein VTN96DRAFT_3476 [Rasamsonia emersonii]